jgi:DNA-binding response OmpR family regulator
MDPVHSILYVDDDPVFASALQGTLRTFGFHVELVDTYKEVHRSLNEGKFDLILVDFDLGTAQDRGGGGPGLVIELRASRVTLPILIYTVHAAEWYELAALKAGADGFILKNDTSPALLISRIQAAIRRHERDTGKQPSTTHKLGIGRYTLDKDQRVLDADQKGILLTVKETKILEVMGKSPTRIFSPEELLASAWANRDLQKNPDSLKGVLKRLRKKLEENDVQNLIENVKGRGFKLMPPTLDHAPAA